jgi:hypothetical protein
MMETVGDMARRLRARTILRVILSPVGWCGLPSKQREREKCFSPDRADYVDDFDVWMTVSR